MIAASAGNLQLSSTKVVREAHSQKAPAGRSQLKLRKYSAKYTFAGPDRQLESHRKVAVLWPALRAQNLLRVRELAHSCSELAQHTCAERLRNATCTEHLLCVCNLH